MAFSFNSVGHFFATIAHDLKSVGSFLAAHRDQIVKVEDTAVNLLGLVDPKLAVIGTQIERGSNAVLGEVLSVIDKDSDAASANGVNVQLDAALTSELKLLLADIKKLKPEATTMPAMILAAAQAAKASPASPTPAA